MMTGLCDSPCVLGFNLYGQLYLVLNSVGGAGGCRVSGNAACGSDLSWLFLPGPHFSSGSKTDAVGQLSRTFLCPVLSSGRDYKNDFIFHPVSEKVCSKLTSTSGHLFI